MSRQKHCHETLRALRVRFIAGDDLTVLAAEVGLAALTLRGLWSTYGIVDELPMANRMMLSKAEKREIHRRWCGGESLRSISRARGLPYSALHKALTAAGLRFDRSNGVPAAGGGTPAERLQQERWWSTAMGFRAQDPPVPYPKIHEILKRRGYPHGWRVLANATKRYQRRLEAAKGVRR